jgi:hypothetical protein
LPATSSTKLLKVTEMTDFYDYVLSFYGKDGLYPMGATLPLIQQATNDIIQILQIKNEEFCGDSIDRELVRDLLIDKYKLQFSK